MEGTPTDRTGDAPRKPSLHPFTRVAFWASMAGLVIDLVLVVSFFFFPRIFTSLSLDNLVLMGVLAIMVFGPGLHALIKARVPGETLVERKTKPTARDIHRILIAFGIMGANLALALLFAYVTISFMTGRR